jgi:hypothetical protein
MVRRDKHNVERFYRRAVPLDRFSSGKLWGSRVGLITDT